MRCACTHTPQVSTPAGCSASQGLRPIKPGRVQGTPGMRGVTQRLQGAGTGPQLCTRSTACRSRLATNMAGEGQYQGTLEASPYTPPGAIPAKMVRDTNKALEEESSDSKNQPVIAQDSAKIWHKFGTRRLSIENRHVPNLCQFFGLQATAATATVKHTTSNKHIGKHRNTYASYRTPSTRCSTLSSARGSFHSLV